MPRRCLSVVFSAMEKVAAEDLFSFAFLAGTRIAPAASSSQVGTLTRVTPESALPSASEKVMTTSGSASL